MSPDERVVLEKIVMNSIQRANPEGLIRLYEARDEQIKKLQADYQEAIKQQGEYKTGRRDAFVLKCLEVLFSVKQVVSLGDVAEMSISLADLLIEGMDKKDAT